MLDKGALAESGGHEELMSRGGVYKKLWEAQAGRITPGTWGAGGAVPAGRITPGTWGAGGAVPAGRITPGTWGAGGAVPA